MGTDRRRALARMRATAVAGRRRGRLGHARRVTGGRRRRRGDARDGGATGTSERESQNIRLYRIIIVMKKNLKHQDLTKLARLKPKQ